MHIVIDAHLAVKEIDGVARYLIGLLSELPNLDSNIRYTVLTLPEEASSLPAQIFEAPNVRRRVVRLDGPSPKQHLIMCGLLRALGADLYHHPQYDLPLRVPVPTVVTLHDMKYLLNFGYLRGGGRLKQFYIRQSLKHTLRAADQIIAVSHNTLRDVQRLFTVDPEKVTVIYHGVETSGKGSSQGGALPELPQNFLLFVGTRRPHKNIDGLVRALHRLRTEYGVHLYLVVAGKAYADYREPERLAEDLGMSPFCHFLDFVEDESLGVLYRKARAVALVSHYEGFGLPLIEAMAHGTPVVGSNAASVPEILAGAGLLADPARPEDIAAQVYRILTEPGLADKLAARGRERAEHFTWKSVAKATINVYNKALSRPFSHDNSLKT